MKASINKRLCIKWVIIAGKRAKKTYEDLRLKVAEAKKVFQDHANLIKDNDAAKRQVKAAEDKLAEMRRTLEVVVIAAKEVEAAKEVV